MSNLIGTILSGDPWHQQCRNPRLSHCTWNNGATFESRSVDFKMILTTFTCARSNVLRVDIAPVCGTMDLFGMVTSLLPWIIAGANQFTDWQWDWYMEFPPLCTFHFVVISIFLTFRVIKGIKNGYPCNVKWRHLALCLGYLSDQGRALRASDLHHVRATIFNHFSIACGSIVDVT